MLVFQDEGKTPEDTGQCACVVIDTGRYFYLQAMDGGIVIVIVGICLMLHVCLSQIIAQITDLNHL